MKLSIFKDDEMLSKEQMKNIKGGNDEYKQYCWVTPETTNPQCAQESYRIFPNCSDNCSCQDLVDSQYANNDCIRNIDCGCQ